MWGPLPTRFQRSSRADSDQPCVENRAGLRGISVLTDAEWRFWSRCFRLRAAAAGLGPFLTSNLCILPVDLPSCRYLGAEVDRLDGQAGELPEQ